MAWLILLILIGWPILEIAVFVAVGQQIGWLNTILLALGAGVLGLWLLRSEGLSLLARAQADMRNGIVPMDKAFDAVCLVGAGLLLLLPGFLTDFLALILFLPITRSVLRRAVEGAVERGRRDGRVATHIVIEGEYERVNDPAANPPQETPRETPREPPREIVPPRD